MFPMGVFTIDVESLRKGAGLEKVTQSEEGEQLF